MGGISKDMTTDSLALHSQPPHCRKMCSSWDKVRSYLDMMDIPDLQSSLPFSSTSSLSSTSSDSNQHPLSIGARSWLVGEKTTQQILSVIQPTTDSEARRKEIIEYLQRLIGDTFGIKVFPFGSVPLKTYLPHGDVDLAAISHYGTSQDLAADICTLLENEEMNNANIPVKDVLCVPAQIRVVKCTVGDIAVDISFNQTAGLCALYFLEQVDQFIGRDHLFKLSVILIKAWCYYESRLLGGFHGLISTYALETMVLHVINLFHSSLHCPLAVLYKFLEYYSEFDWERYCVGINGLVLISLLPEIEVIPSCNCDELLLTEEFLRSSREALLPSTGVVGSNPAFPIKFLNILDPLRDDNNLGRSVSKGNFFRIKCALSYGTQRLRDILMLPPEKIGVGLEKFFNNTLERNGRGRRVDVSDPVPPYGSESSGAKTANSNLLAGIQYGLWFDDYDMLYPVQPATLAGCVVWNNGWGEVGPNIQYDQNAFYDMEESSPSSGDSPRAFVNHAAPAEEHWTPRGSFCSTDNMSGLQINNPTFEEKWKPRWASSSFDNTRGTRLSNATASAEETWKLRDTTSSDSPRGTGPNNVGLDEEKWKPRRATFSVDNPRTTQLNGAASYEEKWKSRVSPSSVDRHGGFWLSNAASHEEKWKSRVSPSSVDRHGGFWLNNAASVEEKWKSSGTFAYRPPHEHLVQENLTLEKDWVARESRNKQEYRKDGENKKDAELLDSRACIPRESDISSGVGERSCPVNYSMDEFPLLPGSKPIPIKASPVAPVVCDQVNNTSVSLDSTELGSFKPSSPTSVSLSEAGKHSDSDGSVFLDVPSDPTSALDVLDEDKASLKREDKTEVPVQPLLLTDVSEFPPLGRPAKPVIPLSKKEFPPLSACLRSQKKKWKK